MDQGPKKSRSGKKRLSRRQALTMLSQGGAVVTAAHLLPSEWSPVQMDLLAQEGAFGPTTGGPTTGGPTTGGPTTGPPTTGGPTTGPPTTGGPTTGPPTTSPPTTAPPTTAPPTTGPPTTPPVPVELLRFEID